MRPRVFPAEDSWRALALHVRRVASMRPRVFPAEDSRDRLEAELDRACSFNEAAGIPRGRPRVSDEPDGSAGFNEAAGIPRGRLAPAAASFAVRRFNEAAGIPRGRRRRPSSVGRGRYARFNEAAGIPRGRLSLSVRGLQATRVASMRPRVFPAEDTVSSTGPVVSGVQASMRPRVFPAEDVATQARAVETVLARFNEAAGIPRGRPTADRSPAVYPGLQ